MYLPILQQKFTSKKAPIISSNRSNSSYIKRSKDLCEKNYDGGLPIKKKAFKMKLHNEEDLLNKNIIKKEKIKETLSFISNILKCIN